MDKKDLITLKQAAVISGYSADYVGQLIRAGKIPGKQVYSNVQWMTTAEAVIAYKKEGQSSRSTFKNNLANRGRKFEMEIQMLRLFFQNFRPSIPLFLGIILSFIIIVAFIFTTIINHNTFESKNFKEIKKIDNFTF